MNIEQAVSTVLDQFNLDENINRTLIPIIVNDMSIPVESRHRDIMKTDFYLDGFKYYDFEDDIVHNETTSINMCYFENTPEKFLLSLTNIAKLKDFLKRIYACASKHFIFHFFYKISKRTLFFADFVSGP